MYFMNSFSTLRRVPTPLLLVVGLHLAVVWALLNGLRIHDVREPPPTRIIADVIDRPHDPVDQVIPDNPKLIQPEIYAPPVTPITDPEVPPLDTDNLQLSPTGAGFETPPKAAPVVRGAAVDPRQPLTQPPYPPASIRSNETGAVAIVVLVGTDGRVRDARVAQSSGSSRLDQAALTEARQHWHLRPATRDGVPFEEWLTLRVVFKLESR